MTPKTIMPPTRNTVGGIFVSLIKMEGDLAAEIIEVKHDFWHVFVAKKTQK